MGTSLPDASSLASIRTILDSIIRSESVMQSRCSVEVVLCQYLLVDRGSRPSLPKYTDGAVTTSGPTMPDVIVGSISQ